MTQEIVNLTSPVIVEKVEKVLSAAPIRSKISSKTLPTLQDKLVTYVLRRMPTCYITTDDVQSCFADTPVNCFSSAQQAQMDDLIQEGLQHLMTQRKSWEMPESASISEIDRAPSSWFG